MKKILLLVAAFGLFTFSCTKDFEEINENPNSPQNVAPEFLLANVVSVTADRQGYEQSFRLGSFLAQHIAGIEFSRVDRYELGQNADYWNQIFRLMSDIRSIKENEATNPAYGAVGDIMASYLFSQLTDLWVDVPYSDAVKAREGVFSPKYDTQESIYTTPETGILAVLKKSAETLENTSSQIRGDVMFAGDLDKWVRFANSLRVRYYLRISNRITDYSELQALATSGKLMQSNDDNALVPYLSSAPNQFPLSIASLGVKQELRMSNTIDSLLTQWNDPRINALFSFTAQSQIDGAPEHIGLLNGLSTETISARGISLNSISLLADKFRNSGNGWDGIFMQYAELQFALAEAVERGFIGGNAKTYYDEGVRANMEYNDVEMPSDYLTNAITGFDGTDNLSKIMHQKWIALFGTGHEAWFNIRRTGIPILVAGPDNFNNGIYPSRYVYPESEQATNGANFNEAAARIGGNTINSVSWWDMP